VTETSNTPPAGRPCDDAAEDAALAATADVVAADIGRAVERITTEAEDETLPPVALAAALQKRGIDFHLRIDHGPDGEAAPHRVCLILDDENTRLLAERIVASDFVFNMRKAGEALTAFAENFRAAAAEAAANPHVQAVSAGLAATMQPAAVRLGKAHVEATGDDHQDEAPTAPVPAARIHEHTDQDPAGGARQDPDRGAA